MIRLLLLIFTVLVSSLHAAVPWENQSYGCSASLPDSAGWQPIEPPEIPGLTTLVVVQNPTRGAVFGITVLSAPPSINLRDPATVQFIEAKLRGFGYDFVGNSMVNVGGREWKQYPVKSPNATGVIRYTSGNGKIFGVTMLLAGGKEAAQDPELQGVAGSFRLFPVVTAAPEPAPAIATAPAPADKPVAATPAPKPADTKTAAEKPAADEPDYMRLGMIAGGGLIVLIILLKLVGGGGGQGGVKPRR